MSKTLTRMWCAAALATAAFTAGAATDEAGNRFIYLAGVSNPHNYPPHVQYADTWENGKMPETSPGSDVYETKADLSSLTWGHWIRFYYDLADGEADNGDYTYSFYLNLVQPLSKDGGWIDGVVPPVVGRSGVYMTSDVAKQPAAQITGTWHLSRQYDYYRLRIDLGAMTFTAVPEGTVFVLVNSDEAPTFDNLDNYTTLTKFDNYYPAGGDLKIRLYDFFNDRWLNPAPGCEEITTGRVEFSTTPSQSMGTPFVIKNWKGGVIHDGHIDGMSGNCGATISSDVVEAPVWSPISPDAIYVIGDFNGWSEFQPVTRGEGADAVYTVEFPAGTSNFKMLLGNMWGADEIGSTGAVSVSDGNSVVKLNVAEDGGLANNTFTPALSAPVTMVVNLTDGTITVPATSGFEMATVDTGDARPVNRNSLFVSTPFDAYQPWKDCSDAVLSSFSALGALGDGTYKGRFYVPYGEFKLRFISELSPKGTPNMVIAPPAGADRALSFVDGVAYSSAAQLPADQAGYWTYEIDDYLEFTGKWVEVTVTPGEKPSVKFEMPDGNVAAKNEIYLIGDMQGWYITDGSMPLRLTTNGGFYGEFDIPAGDYYFRFYSELGDWGNGSIGSGFDDFESVTWNPAVESTSRSACVYGKGDWYVSGWPGGKMYMYVQPEAAACFSTAPIPEAGEVVDPATLKQVYLYDGEEYIEMKKGADGIYKARLTIPMTGDEIARFRLFTKQLPISTEEAEWEGSFALSAPEADFPLSFDDLDVAEASYVAQDYVTNAGANAFTLVNQHNTLLNQYMVTVDLNAGRIYVEGLNRRYYICGGITDGKIPTYATRDEFRQYAVPMAGGILDVPAGKLDATFFQSIADATTFVAVPPTATFTDGFAVAQGYMGWNYTGFTSPGWKGGKVYIGPKYLLDMSVVNELTAVTYLEDWQTTESPMPETAPGSLIYKGKVKFADRVNPYLRFSLGEGGRDEWGNPFVISSNVYSTGTGGAPINLGEEELVPVNGTMTGKMGFGGQTHFSMPSLVGSGEMDVTVDLNTMTMTASVSSENEGAIYETVSDGNSDLDGLTAYPSKEQNDAVVLETVISGEDTEDYDFNLTAPDGSVIVPEGGVPTVVDFDETGSWSGPYVKKNAPMRGRASLRRAASQEATWHFSMPQGETGHLSILVDEANSTLTLFSSAHNEGYFIVRSGGDMKIGIENFGLLKENMLHLTPAGVYEGEISLDADDAAYVIFAKDCKLATGIYTPYQNTVLTTFDLTAGKSEVSQNAFPARGDSYATSWLVKGASGKTRVAFDPANSRLTIGGEGAGVDNVSADSPCGSLSVVPSTGCVVITASVAASVPVYSVTGMLVRQLDLPAGVTTVDLPAGLYVVGSTKVYVR